ATVAVLLVFGLARTTVGDAAALPAALALATAFEWARAATSARVDMILPAALSVVFVGWTSMLAGRDRRWLRPVAVGARLAPLAKGPVGLALPALVAVAYAARERDRAVLRRLGVVPVLGIAAAVAGLWYLAAFAAQGRAFLDVVLRENVVRFID